MTFPYKLPVASSSFNVQVNDCQVEVEVEVGMYTY